MLDPNLFKEDQDKVKVSAEKEQEKKQKLLTTIKPHRGHTLFKVNTETMEISKAEFEKTDIDYLNVVNKNNVSKRKVIVEEGHVYISALNKKNVIKKMAKSINKK
jgi:hypothetical protein